MKFIVPAKVGSTRVADKNWREFAGGKSLTQICVEKLLPLGEVVVSCNDGSKSSLVESWGAEFHLRPNEWAENRFPLTNWIRGTHEDLIDGGFLSSSEAFGWCQVTSPLFNEYKDMLSAWETDRLYSEFDSMVALYPTKGYYLDSGFRPMRWGWGPWHTTGQNLPTMYQMPWVFSILTPDSVRETGYHIGVRPKWYMARCRQVDIDTEEDWEYAQYLYERPGKVAGNQRRETSFR